MELRRSDKECRSLGMHAKRRLSEEVVIPTILYVTETFNMRVAERKKLNVKEMSCLRSVYGVMHGLSEK